MAAKREIQVGDQVAYSKRFLRSTGQYSGDIPHARGRVIALVDLGTETKLAEIEWDKPDIPAKVNTKNLITIQQIAYDQ